MSEAGGSAAGGRAGASSLAGVKDEVADVVAYMLSVSGLPPGRDELPTDRAALAAVVIVPQAE